MTLPAQPIDEILPDVLRAVREHPVVVVHAPTGAGKTTRLPAALLDAGLAGGGAVWTVQPRRVAARSAARFVARGRGGVPGEEVGWHVRFEPRFGSSTRLLYLTAGVAVRRVADDPFLEGVGVVVIDELHERGLDADLALALVRRIQTEVRPDLKIVVMSATLDAARLAAELDGAPVLHSLGRSFPVDIRYAATPPAGPLGERAAQGVRAALASSDGDILAFLPGVGEIHATAGLLDTLVGVDVLPLHGALDADAQDRALVPGPRRRVVLATNVAETSLTIEGITAVVDLGLARIDRHDPASGLDRLDLAPISRAAADQRAGRAGRTAPGVAWRLWTEREHAGRPAFDEPEIRRADLAGVVLQLRAWGEADPSALPWIEPPPARAVDAADAILRALELVDDRGLTPLGRRAAALPIHPRLAVLLLAAADAGHLGAGALAAAVLSGRDPFLRHDAERDPPAPTTDCDVLDRVAAIRAGRDPRLRPAARREVERVAGQLARLAAPVASDRRRGHDVGWGEADVIRRAIASAWSDRLALRRAPGSDRALLRSGRGVRVPPGSGVRDAELFAAIVVDDGPRREGIVRLATAVDRAWVSPTRAARTYFDPDLRQVVARIEERLDALVFSDRPAPSPDPADATRALLEAVRADPDLLPWGAAEVGALQARLSLLAEVCPEFGLPPPDGAWRDAALPDLLAGRRGLTDLDGATLAGALEASLPWAQRQLLAEHAPLRLAVPSGRDAALVWEPGARPVLAVKMQELFGLRATPTVARGRVRVLLHLLAPNGRPQQITDDLESFWANTWPEVRKELRARYPKHDWPVDPYTAAASSRPRRRGG